MPSVRQLRTYLELLEGVLEGADGLLVRVLALFLARTLLLGLLLGLQLQPLVVLQRHELLDLLTSRHVTSRRVASSRRHHHKIQVILYNNA